MACKKTLSSAIIGLGLAFTPATVVDAKPLTASECSAIDTNYAADYVEALRMIAEELGAEFSDSAEIIAIETIDPQKLYELQSLYNEFKDTIGEEQAGYDCLFPKTRILRMHSDGEMKYLHELSLTQS